MSAPAAHFTNGCDLKNSVDSCSIQTFRCKMNSFYVTVSIPLLLVLAGFNHAHGLTTFGKPGNQQPIVNPPNIAKKPCTHQSNCSLIKGTTCLDGYCFCGDNKHPINGQCTAVLKGPNHLCTEPSECVEGAICRVSPNSAIAASNNNNAVQTCQCIEGTPTPNGHCSGSAAVALLPGLIALMIATTRAY